MIRKHMPTQKPIILLTGQPGIGKTTVIKKLAGLAGDKAGGFYTQEIREGGKRKGFEIVTFEGERGYLALKTPKNTFEKEVIFKNYKINLGGLETIAVPSLIRARDEGKIIFMDEIGPMEICSQRFCETVSQLLEDNDVELVGTIVKRAYRFADDVKEHPRVKLIEVLYGNRDELGKKIYKQQFEQWSG